MIGIIGGLGVGATIHYYTALVEAFRQRDLEARLLIAHAEAERVRLLIGDRKLEELAVYLTNFIDQLAAGRDHSSGASGGAAYLFRSAQPIVEAAAGEHA
jgi:aspartate racemase